MIIDTHCHLNFRDFKDDYLDVIERAISNNIYMIIVGSEFKTSQRALNLADSFSKGVYASVGLHPIHLQDTLIENDNENGKYKFVSKGENLIIDNYKKLIKSSKKVLAIGEIGLDYYHIKAKNKEEEIKVKEKQKIVFKEQLELAKEFNLPVIIHCRDAHEDLYNILKDFSDKNNLKNEWGVIHCYSGDYDLAQKYFSLGLKISFTGLISFVNNWDETIKKSPLEKIMVETDSPYLSPAPHRGQRNEPLFVKEVVKKIADLKNLELKEVEDIIFKNSKDFFRF